MANEHLNSEFDSLTCLTSYDRPHMRLVDTHNSILHRMDAPSVHFTLPIVERANDSQALVIVSRQVFEHATVQIDHPIDLTKVTP